MIGFINKITAHAGERDRVAELMMAGSSAMAGCRSYVVASDASSDDVLWVTEVWIDEDSQRSSLEQPEIRAAIEAAMPFIADFESVAGTNSVRVAALAE